MTNSDPNAFDSKNPRVFLAHKKKTLNNPAIFTLLIILFCAFIIGGSVLIYLKYSIGWLLVSLSSIPFMSFFWIKYALDRILPVKNSNTFTDLIAEELLYTLKPNLTPADLPQILIKTQSGSFLVARFSLAFILNPQFSNLLPASTEPIYAAAKQIQKDTNSPTISAAILVVALIQSIPNHEQILSQVKLSPEDLLQGINWYNYLSELSHKPHKSTRSGGIARDFAFGFTPTLQHFAINISEKCLGASKHVKQLEDTDILQKLIHIFSHKGRQNAALIGEYGSGRSAILNYFAEILMNPDNNLPNNLKYCQIYSLDVSSLISAASNNPGELEYLLIKIFNEIYSAKNIILCLDNAHLFFESGAGSIDISNFLTPIIEAGSIRMILIMDEQKFLEISTKNAALANSLNKIPVTPSNREETIKILMDQAPYLEYQHNVFYSYLAITEAYRLSEQYIHDVAMPGKARLLLDSAASFAENKLVTAESVQTAVEKSYGVKIKVAASTDDRKKLLNLESLIHERMIDQTEAVSAVSNALRRAGAGVKSAGRPVGTFLFLGPTGVGKTELAKALSAAYFGGEDNLIRLDMNEFVTSNDVSRLLSDGAKDPLSLTAQVMKKPFSVVLLDELEKAHPSVLTTLLQLLDEGVLRDEKNHEVSFRDCIIIATSNAGANEIRDRIIAGEQIEDFKDEIIENLINNGEFKPEFLNRFDEICLFKPLSKADLTLILDLILASVNETLSPQKISVTVTPEAKAILIEKGYDPKMGARPMRRVVEKTVKNIVAAAILSGAATPGSVLTITPDKININH